MAKRPKLVLAWIPQESAESNARRVLVALARDYFAAGRSLVAEKPQPVDLHPFRLKTKQLRYTLEMFRGIYGDPLEGRLRDLKPVQSALGDVNDCVATAEAFKLGSAFRQFLKKRAERNSAEFYRVWVEEFDAAGREDHWIRCLAGESEILASPADQTEPPASEIPDVAEEAPVADGSAGSGDDAA